MLISLSSFGAAEVRRHGQLWFMHLARQAGADGVEVRGELLTDAARELPALADAVQQAGLWSVYSSPEGLWSADGHLDAAALERALQAAALLGSPRLKMSIGGFAPRSHHTMSGLGARLNDTAIDLVIENDQTVAAGTLTALRTFFEVASAHRVAAGMTFDMGNWHWTGECPLQAAEAFAAQTRYVHCKGVLRQPRRWVAVPLADSAAPWRAVLRALPSDVPWAIEYPLVGDDLLEVTRRQIDHLRAAAGSLS